VHGGVNVVRRMREQWRVRVAVIGLTLAVGIGAFGGVAGATGTSHTKALAMARRGLLQKGDFPKGWTTSGSPTSGSGAGSGSGPFDAADDAALAACLGVSESALNANAPNASTPEFDDNGQNLSVDNQVTFFPTARAAIADVALLALPKTVPCFNEILSNPDNDLTKNFANGIGKGAKVGKVVVTGMPHPPYGQESGALQIDFPVTDQGITFTIHFGLVALTKGRSESDLSFISVAGFPPVLETHLEKLSAQRLIA
jgi:hypothetical protein